RPVQQPRPPIWVGGKGDRLLELCARRADGWNTVWVWTPDAYVERVKVLASSCEKLGRDPATVTRSVGLFALVGEDERDLARRFRRLREDGPSGLLDGTELDQFREGRLVGTVEQVREQLAAWEALDVSTLVVSVGPVPFSLVSADDVDLVAAACSLVAQ